MNFELSQEYELVWEYLSDMSKFASIHPVITKIEKQKDACYLVYETIKIGFVPYSFTYPVEVAAQPERQIIVMTADVRGLLEIKLNFKLTRVADKTLVAEEVLFRSVIPLTFIMNRIFRKQHKVLFERLNNMVNK